MLYKTFRSIIEQYPFKLMYNNRNTKEYQYNNSDLCRFLLVKFSIYPNFIEVPFGFDYSNIENMIVPISKKNIVASSYLDYKHLSKPSISKVHEELSRLVKQIKETQYKTKLKNIQIDF